MPSMAQCVFSSVQEKSRVRPTTKATRLKRRDGRRAADHGHERPQTVAAPRAPYGKDDGRDGAPDQGEEGEDDGVF